jgi:hypothetical protein
MYLPGGTHVLSFKAGDTSGSLNAEGMPMPPSPG